MTDKTFIFFIRDIKTDEYYYINSVGEVSNDTTPIAIGDCVDSWRDVSISLKRMMDNWGVFREYAVDLKFVNEGAKILKYITYTQNLMAQIEFIIHKLDTASNEYNLWLKCEMDMSSFKSDDISVSINLKEYGLVGVMRDKAEIPYSVDVENDALNIEVGGAKLRASSTWVIGSTSKYQESLSGQMWLGKELRSLTIPSTTHGGDVQAGDFIRPFNQGWTSSGGHVELTPPIGSNAIPREFVVNYNRTSPSGVRGLAKPFVGWSSVRFKGNIHFHQYRLLRDYVGYSGVVSLWIYIQKLTSNATNWVANTRRVYLGSSNSIPSDVVNSFSIPFEASMAGTIADDEMIYLVISRDHNMPLDASVPTLTDSFYILLEDSDIDISYLASVPTTICKGYRYSTFINKFLNKMTNGAYSLNSNILTANFNNTQRANNFDSKPRNCVVLSGDSVRGVPKSKITTTWKDILKDLWSQYGIVPTYHNGVVYLEPLKDSFNDIEVFNIQSINNVSFSYLTEKLFNQVQVGQTEVNNQNEVGRNEFNTKITFEVTDINSTSAILDLISPFRSDMYGIEEARADGISGDNKDTQFNEDIFVIEIADIPVNNTYVPYRVNIPYILGIEDASGAYNITRTPKRALARHYNYIKSFYDKSTLKYTSIAKNPSLDANIRVPYNPIGRVVEIADIPTNLSTIYGVSVRKLFLPIVMEFDGVSDYNLVELIGSNLNGVLKTRYKGIDVYGYILDIGISPATRESYKIKMLLHIDTDLKQLIG